MHNKNNNYLILSFNSGTGAIGDTGGNSGIGGVIVNVTVVVPCVVTVGVVTGATTGLTTAGAGTGGGVGISGTAGNMLAGVTVAAIDCTGALAGVTAGAVVATVVTAEVVVVTCDTVGAAVTGTCQSELLFAPLCALALAAATASKPRVITMLKFFIIIIC